MSPFQWRHKINNNHQNGIDLQVFKHKFNKFKELQKLNFKNKIFSRYFTVANNLHMKYKQKNVFQ